MAITLNHTIVPCFDKVASAKFYSRVFGFEYVGVFSHFIVVRVNDTLSLDFDNQEQFMPLHYAFKVSEPEFGTLFTRLQAEHIPYGSGPGNADDMTINHNYGGRGVYFRDPNGHLLEMLTADYVIPSP
ncbi:VOC family protein [Nitrosomonas ureae]|uniref:Catechol 2,3-dioxygenase n=1 Tax=Nitrosomonas ureae TaxID=44577 RepID=A0A1H5TJD0_9PROT|nr:VOC family protein [Nitrosomonas ureae]SEF62863.1 Catechol 2,3-dioxygenase [Nitrosomonas ureae]